MWLGTHCRQAAAAKDDLSVLLYELVAAKEDDLSVRLDESYPPYAAKDGPSKDDPLPRMIRCVVGQTRHYQR